MTDHWFEGKTNNGSNIYTFTNKLTRNWDDSNHPCLVNVPKRMEITSLIIIIIALFSSLMVGRVQLGSSQPIRGKTDEHSEKVVKSIDSGKWEEIIKNYNSFIEVATSNDTNPTSIQAIQFLINSKRLKNTKIDTYHLDWKWAKGYSESKKEFENLITQLGEKLKSNEISMELETLKSFDRQREFADYRPERDRIGELVEKLAPVIRDHERKKELSSEATQILDSLYNNKNNNNGDSKTPQYYLSNLEIALAASDDSKSVSECLVEGLTRFKDNIKLQERFLELVVNPEDHVYEKVIKVDLPDVMKKADIKLDCNLLESLENSAPPVNSNSLKATLPTNQQLSRLPEWKRAVYLASCSLIKNSQGYNNWETAITQIDNVLKECNIPNSNKYSSILKRALKIFLFTGGLKPKEARLEFQGTTDVEKTSDALPIIKQANEYRERIVGIVLNKALTALYNEKSIEKVKEAISQMLKLRSSTFDEQEKRKESKLRREMVEREEAKRIAELYQSKALNQQRDHQAPEELDPKLTVHEVNFAIKDSKVGEAAKEKFFKLMDSMMGEIDGRKGAKASIMKRYVEEMVKSDEEKLLSAIAQYHIADGNVGLSELNGMRDTMQNFFGRGDPPINIGVLGLGWQQGYGLQKFQIAEKQSEIVKMLRAGQEIPDEQLKVELELPNLKDLRDNCEKFKDIVQVKAEALLWSKLDQYPFHKEECKITLLDLAKFIGAFSMGIQKGLLEKDLSTVETVINNIKSYMKRDTSEPYELQAAAISFKLHLTRYLEGKTLTIKDYEAAKLHFGINDADLNNESLPYFSSKLGKSRQGSESFISIIEKLCQPPRIAQAKDYYMCAQLRYEYYMKQGDFWPAWVWLQEAKKSRSSDGEKDLALGNQTLPKKITQDWSILKKEGFPTQLEEKIKARTGQPSILEHAKSILTVDPETEIDDNVNVSKDNELVRDGKEQAEVPVVTPDSQSILEQRDLGEQPPIESSRESKSADALDETESTRPQSILHQETILEEPDVTIDQSNHQVSSIPTTRTEEDIITSPRAINIDDELEKEKVEFPKRITTPQSIEKVEPINTNNVTQLLRKAQQQSRPNETDESLDSADDARENLESLNHHSPEPVVPSKISDPKRESSATAEDLVVDSSIEQTDTDSGTDDDSKPKLNLELANQNLPEASESLGSTLLKTLPQQERNFEQENFKDVNLTSRETSNTGVLDMQPEQTWQKVPDLNVSADITTIQNDQESKSDSLTSVEDPTTISQVHEDPVLSEQPIRNNSIKSLDNKAKQDLAAPPKGEEDPGSSSISSEQSNENLGDTKLAPEESIPARPESLPKENDQPRSFSKDDSIEYLKGPEDSENSKDSKNLKGLEDSKDTKDPNDSGSLGNLKDLEDSEDSKNPKDSNDTKGSEDLENLKDSKGSDKISQQPIPEFKVPTIDQKAPNRVNPSPRPKAPTIKRGNSVRVKLKSPAKKKDKADDNDRLLEEALHLESLLLNFRKANPQIPKKVEIVDILPEDYECDGPGCLFLKLYVWVFKQNLKAKDDDQMRASAAAA